MVRRCIERPRDLPLQEELRSWIGHFQTSQHYDRVVLFDAAGNKWMMAPHMDQPPSSVTARAIRETLRSRQPTFTDFYRTERNQSVGLRLFVPILDEQTGGRPLGVLMLRIDPSTDLSPSSKAGRRPAARPRRC